MVVRVERQLADWHGWGQLGGEGPCHVWFPRAVVTLSNALPKSLLRSLVPIGVQALANRFELASASSNDLASHTASGRNFLFAIACLICKSIARLVIVSVSLILFPPLLYL